MQICIRVRICSTFPRGANSVEQISTRVHICPRVQIAHMNATCYHNLILDFDKLPIFSIRTSMKINYISNLWSWLLSVVTTSSALPGCQVEQLEFLVHGLCFARFYFQTISLPNLGSPCMITEYNPLQFM